MVKPLSRHFPFLTFVLLCVSFAFVTNCHITEKAPAPERILIADRIITGSDAAGDSIPTAVAIDRGWITAVGSERKVLRLAGPETEVIRLEGATIYPGFSDSHMHLSGVGEELLSLNLKGTESLSDLLRRVSERHAETPDGGWIVGRGWLESEWDPPVFPTRFDLDAICPDHPVWLKRVDGHAGVANSLALEIAGITTESEAPPGGQFARDSEGQLTGLVVDAAQILVERKIPKRSQDQLRQALIVGARDYARRGWTAIQIAGTTMREARLIESLVESGEIPLRVYNAIYGPGEDANTLLEEGPVGLQRGSRYTRRSIKVSYDGALGSGGAAMLEPYVDPELAGPESDNRGLLNFHLDAPFIAMLDHALIKGIQVQVHAIGDHANRHVLDLYEDALHRIPSDAREVPDPRLRIEHAQILNPADLPRFAELGVIPSMQASHAITYLHFAKRRIGAERLRYAYAWRSLIDLGSKVPGGSDAPVEAGDPRVEIYAATARRDLEGFQAPHWHPEQSVKLEEALLMLTEWSAYAAFQEDWRGRIAVGQAADFTILDRDLFEIDLDQIPKVRCLMTVVAGQVIYDGRVGP